MRFGIDLGTTRTVVVRCDGEKYPVVRFKGRRRGEWFGAFPTLAAVRKNDWVYGVEALECRAQPDWSIVASFKRALTASYVSLDASVDWEGQSIHILDLLTQYLCSLKDALVLRSNIKGLKEDEELEVMVATPAHAHSTQRFLTLEAFRRAGFTVKGVYSEPSAAGVHYAQKYGKTLTSQRDRVLIYDWGGGTFDVSLMERNDDTFRVLQTAGKSTLGGDDFDSILVDLVLDGAELTKEDLSPATMTRLRLLCRDEKESLHPNTRNLEIHLGAAMTDAEREATGWADDDALFLETSWFYDACKPLIQETLDLADLVLKAAATEVKGVVDEQARLAGVFVVGGASSLPIVGRMVRERFGRRYHRSKEASAATAIGLATAISLDEKLVTDDRLARFFGVFREADNGERAAFDVLVHPDTILPESEEATFSLARYYQPAHNIGHFRFVECDQLHDYDPDGNVSVVAEVLFPFEPALQSPSIALEEVPVERQAQWGPWIEERYEVDSSGCVSFSIKDLNTGYKVEHRLA